MWAASTIAMSTRLRRSIAFFWLLVSVWILKDSTVSTWSPAMTDGLRFRGSAGSAALAAASSDSSSNTKPILVVGATGRVGRKVVNQLLSQNRRVRALVRNPTKAEEIFGTPKEGDTSLEFVVADVARYDEYDDVLDKAVEGCSSIVSVMGSTRVSKIADFLPWRLLQSKPTWADRSHPYYGNYLGQKKLIELAEKHGIQRFIRLTGLSLAYSAFNPISILFNSLLSISNRWNGLTERALYESKVPYVVLRPGGMRDDERNATTTGLQIDASGRLPFPGRVSRSDVAALAIAAADMPANSPSYTLACRWCGEDLTPRPQGRKEDGYATAEECIAKLISSKVSSPKPPHSKPYRLAVTLAAYSLFGISAKVLLAMWQLVVKLIRG